VVLSINQVDTALDLATYTSGGTSTRPGTFICDETDPDCTAAGSDADAVRAHQYAADTYNFYLTNHGRDSIDGAGMQIISSVHYTPSPPTAWCNASWNGTQMSYGDGCIITVDDVVGHELTHGVTQHESNLIYLKQSGAINESLSDIWGEFVDLTNGRGTDTSLVRWQVAEDSDDGPFRDMKNPPAHGQPDKMSSSFYQPESNPSDNYGVHTTAAWATRRPTC